MLGVVVRFDPFPGQKKICQCLVERPRALDPAERVKRAIGLESPNLGETEWSWCGGDGTRCTCEGLVRYGSTGDASMYADGSKWFKDHPEVMKWTYLKSYGELECSQRTFGFDPFPDQKKICQCLQGYDEQFLPDVSAGGAVARRRHARRVSNPRRD